MKCKTDGFDLKCLHGSRKMPEYLLQLMIYKPVMEKLGSYAFKHISGEE